MVKQLYYSELHSKNIEICLSKLYIGTLYKFNYINLAVGTLLIMSRVQAAVFV